jgi:hypothetical protein
VAANVNSDKLIMLLSADWFAPFWKVFGLTISAEQQVRVQRSAREVVRSMMKGRDSYWDIDFDTDRVRRTERSFLESASKISNTVEKQISGLLVTQQTETDSRQLATTLWLFGALFDQLCSTNYSGMLPKVEADTLRSLKSLWVTSFNADANEDEFERALLRSNTEWDRYLRNLTADLPTSLADWASLHLERPPRFRRFWAHLYWIVSAEARCNVREWLIAESAQLADPNSELVIPEWMEG